MAGRHLVLATHAFGFESVTIYSDAKPQLVVFVKREIVQFVHRKADRELDIITGETIDAGALPKSETRRVGVGGRVFVGKTAIDPYHHTDSREPV
ncbi:hypothetical protein PG990_002403 [Apiospora arundinis]